MDVVMYIVSNLISCGFAYLYILLIEVRYHPLPKDTKNIGYPFTKVLRQHPSAIHHHHSYLMVVLVKAHLHIEAYKFTQMSMSVGILSSKHYK